MLISPWDSLPARYVRLKQKAEPRGHAEELPDMQPETAEKQKKELEELTACFADADKLQESMLNELSMRRERRASACSRAS